MSPASRDSLSFVAEVPEKVAPGETVGIRLVVENSSGADVPLYLTGRPVAFDVEVTNETGAVVWRRLEGQVVPMVLQVRVLAPGESLAFEAEWDQRTRAGRQVPPGAYGVRGFLPSDDPEPRVTPLAALRIEAS